MAVSFDGILFSMAPYRSVMKLDPHVRVLSYKPEGWVGVKQLMFRAEMEGKGTGDAEKDGLRKTSYLTYVMFNNVAFAENRDAEFQLPVQIAGKQWFAQTPDLSKNPLRLFCSCPDFRFRFSKELYDAGALIGNWKRYEKVPGSNRGPVNPDHVLGICKHIYSFMTALSASGNIKE